jgi:hypothetical protein
MITNYIGLNFDEEVMLRLPDGRCLSVMLHENGEEDSLPEIDIVLPEEMAVNCFGERLKMAPSIGEYEHIRLAKQIIIPVEAATQSPTPHV